MHRLTFISVSDIERVENSLKKNLSQWVYDTIAVSDVSLTVSLVSINDIDVSVCDSLFCVESTATGVLQDDNCDWAEFVFGKQLAFCPRDELFPIIIERVKQNLFSDVFLLDAALVQFDASKKLLTSVNTYYCIEVSGAAFGVFKLIVHQGHFSSLIDKPKRSRVTAKLSSRFTSIASLTVAANIRIEFGSVPFDELIRLSSTRILNSSNSIKNQFTMNIEGVDVCNVAIGKRADKKAFLILKE